MEKDRIKFQQPGSVGDKKWTKSYLNFCKNEGGQKDLKSMKMQINRIDNQGKFI